MTESKNHILKYLNKGIRFDGRKLDEFRKVEVEYDISKSAEGSARVKIGDTEILAGVKLAVEEPYPDTPDSGNLMVGAEFLPLSNPEFESGPPGIDSIELSRVVDRGIREANAIDTKKLVIKKGEKVWAVMIDITPLNDSGNLFDAAGLGAIAALKNTKFVEYKDGIIDYKKKTNKELPIKKIPVPITVIKIGEHFIVDPTNEEERFMEARLTVTSSEDGNLCALQKGGDSPLTTDEINKMLDLGIKKSAELRKYLG
jgi:exosome complex component RRP42